MPSATVNADPAFADSVRRIVGQASRDNNFGLIRLVLACLVIVSHSPELIDGNRSRELLTRLAGTVSLGGVAVAGFFMVSGYLIAKSCDRRTSIADYALKRIGRIFPGYIASFFVCAVLLAPWVGATVSPLSTGQIIKELGEIIGLRPPVVPGAFTGLPYDSLNGSMWTIAYEMRCYGLAFCLGLFGLYRGRARFALLAIALALIAADAVAITRHLPLRETWILGKPEYLIPLTGFFCIGACFYAWRDQIKLRAMGALAGALIAAICLHFEAVANAAIAICLGYALFWFALCPKPTRVARAANKNDISYGVYLYAFPIQNALIYFFGIRDPWLLTFLALILSVCCGFLSWFIVERPALRIFDVKMRRALRLKTA